MNLDDEQQEIVEAKDSQVIVAPPGSGKTRILVERAKRLYEDGRNAVCITFTRSAAREITSRLPYAYATTVHSLCCQQVGWKKDWGYEGLLYRYLLSKPQEKFDDVLLDEFQDVNELELDVILSLVGDRLFAVGDPFQSIYGFQNAMGMSMVGILGGLGCRKVELHGNYRSCPEIVSKLNGWFSRGTISKGTKSTGSTAILCRRNDALEEVSDYLRSAGTPHRLVLSMARSGDRQNREQDIIAPSNLSAMTIHTSKGREFDHVILFDWSPGSGSEGEEGRVYYVSLSRASQSFTEESNLSSLHFLT